MLTLVEVTNSRSDKLRLPLMNTSGGYSVRDIEGLDPVNAALTSSSVAQVDGAQFQNARRDVRNITMKLGLEPDYAVTTVQSLRSGLYDFLMPKSNVQLGFYLDNVLYAITSGQVESFQNVLFSADPEVDVSIICYDPDLYGPTAAVLSNNTRTDTNSNVVNYPGSSDAGVIFVLNVNRVLTDFWIINTTPSSTRQKMEITGAFVAGDVITINTIRGSKAVTLTRGGITTSLLAGLDPLATWVSLQKGVNNFGAFAAGASIPFTMTYTPQYGGI
jgi:hypothetical protein